MPRSPFADRMTRRALLATLGSALAETAQTAHAEDGGASGLLDRIDLELPGDPHIAKRCLLLVPRRIKGGGRLRLLVLCHGMNETTDELLGIRAWSESYGLAYTYARLANPPLTRTPSALNYLSNERLLEINRDLRHRPFAGLAIACPFTPNPYKDTPSAVVLDHYADWIERTLVPEIKNRIPILPGSAHLGIDGVSLGGYMSMEVFLRKPELFGTVGAVQGAFGPQLADQYARGIADAIARLGVRRVHVATSSLDPYRAANERLVQRLRQLGVPAAFSAAPGPHDKPWLREVGSLEMLLFHDRMLARV